MKNAILLTAAIICVSFALAQPAAQAQDDPFAQWLPDIERFEQYDRKNSWPADAVLFVGSSSIRIWNTREHFPDLPVINRGFGGSQIDDVNHFISETVLKYDPAAIVFYCGDNDIAAGKSPQTVLADYKSFTETVRENLGDVPIVYLAIKPSKSRWDYWPAMREANSAIEQFCDDNEGLYFADTATIMLDETGSCVDEYYLSDRLHLSEKGYQVWKNELEPLIMSILQTEDSR